MSAPLNIARLLGQASEGVRSYLHGAVDEDLIDAQLCHDAISATLPNLSAWLQDEQIDRIASNTKQGIARAIEAGQWEPIVNAFRRSVSFGTGGIRGMMAFDRASIVRLKDEGLNAPILKGPNTINDIVLLRVSSGVARFGQEQGYSRIVIGYDSRVRGGDFAAAIAQLFLAYGFTVFLFDEPCPYPEVTFAIPYGQIKADLGILISASHNDYRYNGYKLSCANGSQFDPDQRDRMYNDYIAKATFADIRLCPLDQAQTGQLRFLGGAEPLEDVDYDGAPRVNIHDAHRDHILGLLTNRALLQEQAADRTESLQMGFCAFHGVGRKAVPRLMRAVGFDSFKSITQRSLNDLDGLFPSFCSDPGREQQPDPGDPRAARVAVESFQAEFPGQFDQTDIIIGTDPDADRCGVIVKVPEAQQHLYDGRPYTLLPADDMWALIVWYRLHWEIKRHGQVVEPASKFIVQSMTTCDAIVRLAGKHGLGAVRTWVGFASLAAAVRMVWQHEPLGKLTEGRSSPHDALCHPFICDAEGMDAAPRSINYAAMEQSNGFSILGGPPPDEASLGAGGHVRDKDGTLAAILIAEIASYAKASGTTLFELVDRHIYLDPDVGLFVNRYEPDPLDGEYPGIEGDRKKKGILRRVLGLFQWAKAGGLEIGPLAVTDACIYRTGKYDHVYRPTYDFQFPDEGVRFYFSADRLSHATVRPSGTGNSLRFHVQLYSQTGPDGLIADKGRLRRQADQVMDDLRCKLQAPRD